MQISSTVALKEWAVTIDELGRGTQILIFRKGGIKEDDNKFKIVSETFFLYPGLFHQDEKLLRYTYKDPIDKFCESVMDSSVSIKYFAKLHENIKIADEAQLKALEDCHIWTEQFVMERFMWKKKQPLHMLLLRVYKLNEPIVIPVLSEYKGCKSWINLPEEYASTVGNPVLGDAEFIDEVNKIKNRLQKAVARSM